jgi:hypothetical protein
MGLDAKTFGEDLRGPLLDIVPQMIEMMGDHDKDHDREGPLDVLMGMIKE